MRVTRRPAFPLRNTPIDRRLQILAAPASSSSNKPSTCAYCSHTDGRKGTITCLCSLRLLRRLLQSSRGHTRFIHMQLLLKSHNARSYMAIPSPSLGLHLDTRTFGASMGYRLGLDLIKPGECRAFTYDQVIDAKGDHALHCHDCS